MTDNEYGIPKPSRRCNHHLQEDINFQKLENSTHFGKWVCSLCERFVSWSKHPKTIVADEKRRSEMRIILRDNIDTMSEGILKDFLFFYSTSNPHIVQQSKYAKILATIEGTD